MGDSQSSDGYHYLFDEADAITRKIEEYHRNNDRVYDSPAPVSVPEHSSENISPMINYHHLQNQPTISCEHYSSQDVSHMIYHREFQSQRTMSNRPYWKCLISMLISWLVGLSGPIHIPMPPHLISEGFEQTVSVGEGLTKRQFSQLPTIEFKPSLEDKRCMICQSDYGRGDKLTILPCTHKYHVDCIRQWLQTSKV